VENVFRKSDQTIVPESLKGPVTYLGLESITQNTGNIVGAVVTENPADIKSLKNLFKPRDILYGKLRPNLNKVWLADRKGICSTDIFVIEAIEGTADPALYAYLFRSARFNDAVMGQLKGSQLPRIGWSSFAALQIPLPPLEVQKEFVAEIEGYQKVIDGARAVLDNYRPHIPIRPEWPMERIGDVCQIGDGNHSSNYPKASEMVASGVPFIRGTNLVDGRIDTHDMRYISPLKHVELKKGHLKAGDVIFTNRGEIGKVAIVDEKLEGANLNSQLAWLRPKNGLLPTYLLTALQSPYIQDRLHLEKNGATLQQYTIKQLNELQIPVPPLSTQQAIVAEIEAEQYLVGANRELIVRFEQKIQAALARIWGEEVPAGPEA
jgi:type I restriction enzyme M protein